MSADLTLAPLPTAPTLDGSSLDHYVCSCTSATALCGLELGGGWAVEDDSTPTPDDCLVCVELIPERCPLCGKRGMTQ